MPWGAAFLLTQLGSEVHVMTMLSKFAKELPENP